MTWTAIILIFIADWLQFAVHSSSDSQRRAHVTYEWHTGHWDGCPDEGRCGPGRPEQRSVICITVGTNVTLPREARHRRRHKQLNPEEDFQHQHSRMRRHLVAEREMMCDFKTKPTTTRPCFSICDHHRWYYAWVVGTWTGCQPKPGLTPCIDGLVGIQHRDVTCKSKCSFESSHTFVPSTVCERFRPAPTSERPCLLPCNKNCVVSDFGGWSSCEGQCSNRTRHRTVLALDSDNGRHCGQLVESERCNRQLSASAFESKCKGVATVKDQTGFKFKIGKWTECQSLNEADKKRLAKSITTIGFRRRTVDCVDRRGRVFDISRCNAVETSIPRTTELCHLADSKKNTCAYVKASPAALSSVSSTGSGEWTTYNQSVYAYLIRFQERNPSATFDITFEDGKGLSAGYDGRACDVQTGSDTYKAGSKMGISSNLGISISSSSNIVQCRSFKWISGEWTNCFTHLNCGAGVQNRTVLCVRSSDSVPVSDDSCLFERPEHTRSCFVSCPQDCILSSWSTWSECLPEKCRPEKGKQRDGYRLRIRGIIQAGRNGGSECQHLHAVQPCEYPLCYAWKTTPSGECMLKQAGVVCGPGTRNISVECFNIKGEKVSTRLCSSDARPAEAETCTVPCVNDCILSEWNEWSSCNSFSAAVSHLDMHCSLGQMMAYRTRYRDVLASNGTGGVQCSPHRLVLDKERCGETPCFSFHWHARDWGECVVSASGTSFSSSSAAVNHLASSIYVKCGQGTQQRETFCVDSTGEKVSSKRCLNEYAPVQQRNCSVPCPVDCVVSIFTEWSSCPVSCVSDEMTLFPTQHRRRFILEYPSRGGVKCPDLHETRPCVNLPRCVEYNWQLSEWSGCFFPNVADRCGPGLRTRAVLCLDDLEKNHPDDKCFASDSNVKPDMTQACYVSCNQDPCVFSEWTTWTICSKRCSGVRSRLRTMEGMTNLISECYNRKLYPLHETESCNKDCPEYFEKLVGHWSDCILDSVDHVTETPVDWEGHVIGHVRAAHRHCGIGKRLHAVVCTNSMENVNVSAKVCRTSDYMEEMCFIPCRRDCQLSPWTAWSACSTQSRCGNGERRRSRYLIEPSLDGGRDCPNLVEGEEYQTLPCHVSCEQFQWFKGDWSICTTLSGTEAGAVSPDQCGAGLQSRTIRCIQMIKDGKTAEVEERFCDKRTKPRGINNCQIACPGQCVVSSWSTWSECTEECSGNSRRRRFRTVVRYPSLSNEHCPLLEEFEKCDVDPKCQKYLVQWTSWSPCIPFQELPCGSGKRSRYSECVRGDGNVVSKEYCQPALQPQLDAVSEETCECPCPVDCVVSEWSQWSPCSLTCGLGYQTRSRLIIIPPSGGGSQCPDGLVQTKYCPFQECFRWQSSDWESCNVEVDSCGYGVQHRKLSCIQLGSELKVDPSLCSPVLPAGLKMVSDCYVACPGDCQLSSWSAWSACHRPCDEGPNIDGVQTRSRVILQYPEINSGQKCPTNLIQSRSCPGTGPCPTYTWKAGGWNGERRDIWCQDASGAVVLGGCDEFEKPASVKSCNPPCTVPFSRCQDNNICICSAGFEPIYRKQVLTVLMKCERISAASNRIVKELNENTAAFGKSSASGEVENQARYHPYDLSSDIWMYLIMAIGVAFILILIVSIYVVCRRSRLLNNESIAMATLGDDDNILKERVVADCCIETTMMTSHTRHQTDLDQVDGYTSLPPHTFVDSVYTSLPTQPYDTSYVTSQHPQQQGYTSLPRHQLSHVDKNIHKTYYFTMDPKDQSKTRLQHNLS